MPNCDNCPEHGAMAKELEYIGEEVKESKAEIKSMLNQITEIRDNLLKLESREKVLVAIFALIGTLLSSCGSLIGCLISAYIKH